MSIKQPYELTNNLSPDGTDIVVSQPTGGGVVVKVPISEFWRRDKHTGTQPISTISDAGDSATKNVGTAADTVAAGDHLHDDRYYTETEVDTALSGKSDTSHLHDDRYYTESEIDSALALKEDDLGNPSTNDYVLASQTDGTRSWVKMEAGAKGGGTNAIFYENDTNVTTDYSITAGKNAMSAGPITIDNLVTVTVPTGSTWSIV